MHILSHSDVKIVVKEALTLWCQIKTSGKANMKDDQIPNKTS